MYQSMPVLMPRLSALFHAFVEARLAINKETECERKRDEPKQRIEDRSAVRKTKFTQEPLGAHNDEHINEEKYQWEAHKQ